MTNNALAHLSTSTPASEISSASFDDSMHGAGSEVPSMGDILRNSPAAALLGLAKESQSKDAEGVPTPDEAEQEENQSPEGSVESENDSDEGDQENTEDESKEAEDDSSTQNATELPSEEDIDWEYKIPVTIDGKTEYKSLEDIRKGFATDQHLSQKGRELGEQRKAFESEKSSKLDELVTIGTVLHESLSAEETAIAAQYTEINNQYEAAKKNGDNFTARELKEKRDDAQQEYWAVRNKREALTQQVADKLKQNQAEQQQQLLKNFNENIKTVVPDYSDKVAKSIREFALQEGIPEGLLDNIYDPNIVGFINNYRLLKQATSTGAAKRKAAPAKFVPLKNGIPESVKAKQATQNQRAKVFSGQASNTEQLDFLKRISSVSKKL